MPTVVIALLSALKAFLLRPVILEAVAMWAVKKCVKHSKSKLDDELLALMLSKKEGK